MLDARDGAERKWQRRLQPHPVSPLEKPFPAAGIVSCTPLLTVFASINDKSKILSHYCHKLSRQYGESLRPEADPRIRRQWCTVCSRVAGEAGIDLQSSRC